MDHAENELLTRVGPGTAAGGTLREYGLPVGLLSEINPDRRTVAGSAGSAPFATSRARWIDRTHLPVSGRLSRLWLDRGRRHRCVITAGFST